MDFNHRHPGERLTQYINNMIDAALLLKRNEQPQREYLGGSMLGIPCARQIQYQFTFQPKDDGKDFSAQTLRIFECGHKFEDLSASWLRDAGYDLRVCQKDGKQFGFSFCNGKIKGHIDGVIVGGPAHLKYPCLWEHKSLNNKYWQEVKYKGIQSTKPIYYVQVQLYMAFMGLEENPAVFTALNKDTEELLHEPIDFNPGVAQELSDRAVMILKSTQAGELLPREYKSADHFECRFCSWQGLCWNTNNWHTKPEIQPSNNQRRYN